MVTRARSILQKHFVNLHKQLSNEDKLSHMQVIGEIRINQIPDSREKSMIKWDLTLDVVFALN